MTQIDPQQFAEHFRANVRFPNHIGLTVESVEAGRAVLSVEVGDIHMNGAELVHGGVHASLMDTAMAVALIGMGLHAATTQMNVYYLEPVTGGRLTCVGEVVHRSGRSATLEARVTNDQGKMVAMATGAFRIFSRPAVTQDETEGNSESRGEG
ncbi:MAG: PaaI family thioesterase [Gemmatimonadota bacterium]